MPTPSQSKKPELTMGKNNSSSITISQSLGLDLTNGSKPSDPSASEIPSSEISASHRDPMICKNQSSCAHGDREGADSSVDREQFIDWSTNSPQRTDSKSDEYVALLEKHLSVVEGELKRLSETQEYVSWRPRVVRIGESADMDVTSDLGVAARRPRVGLRLAEARGSESHSRPARIMRIAPQHWRQVKSDIRVDPALDVLLVSSRGHGRIRKPPHRSNVQNKTTASWADNKEDTPKDVPHRLALNSHNLLEALEICTGMFFPSDRNV